MLNPFLSVIIPTLNEEHRLPGALEGLFAFLEAQPYTAEVLVVENGSNDRTLDVARSFQSRYPQLRILQAEQRGKGLAVRLGMLAARGDYRFMADVDFSMPVDEIRRFLPPAISGYDVAIGSREAPGAQRFNEPVYRHTVGRLFNLLIRLLALPGLQDTQCGFKCFRGPVAEELFHRQTLTGWSFDVEVLFIARRLGYRIVELPIPWYFNRESKVSVARDSFWMAADLLTIRLNARRGLYGVLNGSKV